MRSFTPTRAIIGLCLVTLCHVAAAAAAAGTISVEEGIAALPDCAVRAADACRRDGELTHHTSGTAS
jgi:hypothetical protein